MTGGKRPTRKSFTLFFALATLAVLSACVTQPTTPKNSELSDNWRARGKFSFRSEGLTEKGNFDWRQTGKIYRVRLFGPLGFGTVRIEGSEREVIIKSSKGEHQSQDPTALMQQITGMQIPVSELASWLRGTSKGDKDPENQNWEITYQDYMANSELPKRIRATNTNTQNEAEVTLIVSRWEELKENNP